MLDLTKDWSKRSQLHADFIHEQSNRKLYFLLHPGRQICFHSKQYQVTVSEYSDVVKCGANGGWADFVGDGWCQSANNNEVTLLLTQNTLVVVTVLSELR